MSSLSNTSNNHHPVILAGGGLSAKIMALCLHHAKVSVRWYAGQAVPTHRDDRTTTIHAAGMKMLSCLGIIEHCTQPIWPIYSIQVSDADAPLQQDESWPLDWNDQNAPIAYVLQNADLNSACDKLLAEQSLSALPSQIDTVSIANRTLMTSSAEENNFDLLVICAGARTPLITQAGFKIKSQEAGQTALVGLLSADIPASHTAYQRFLPSGPIALMPMDSETYSLVWTLPDHAAEEILSASEEAQNNAVNQACGSMTGHLRFHRPPQRWKLAPSFVPRIASPGVVLAGDSAHSLHPLAGMGLNLALADAATLLDCLIDGQKIGLSASHSFISSSYQRKRKAEITAMTAMTQGLNRLFSRPQGLARLTGGIGMSLMGRTPLMRPIKDIAMGGILSRPHLFTGRLPQN